MSIKAKTLILVWKICPYWKMWSIHIFAAPSQIFSDLSNSHFRHMYMGLVNPALPTKTPFATLECTGNRRTKIQSFLL